MTTMAAMNTVETASFQVSLMAGTPFPNHPKMPLINVSPRRSPGKSQRSPRQQAEDPA